MSKAILVLDEMPDGCKRCPLSIVRFKEYGAECVVKMETVGPRFDWNRPSWCPLQEAEPVRRGYWFTREGWDGIFECSECGGYGPVAHKYCPVCGARMDEVLG